MRTEKHYAVRADLRRAVRHRLTDALGLPRASDRSTAHSRTAEGSLGVLQSRLEGDEPACRGFVPRQRHSARLRRVRDHQRCCRTPEVSSGVHTRVRELRNDERIIHGWRFVRKVSVFDRRRGIVFGVSWRAGGKFAPVWLPRTSSILKLTFPTIRRRFRNPKLREDSITAKKLRFGCRLPSLPFD
jgi:hypothetical protein